MWNERLPEAPPQAEGDRDRPALVESRGSDASTSIEKALEVCEALSLAPRGLSIKDLSHQVRRPSPTVHRLLGVLKRRGYVQQDEDTGRYRLTLKMLDLSFRVLGRSELRLHAYPVLREYVLRTGARTFLAMPAEGEVTYLWTAGADEVAMHTVYGREMPGHCSLYFTPGSSRRLTCLKLERPVPTDSKTTAPIRLGAPGGTRAGQQLACTCAPVYDYTGRAVARVGVFAHDLADSVLERDCVREARDLARLISIRLGSIIEPTGPDS